MKENTLADVENEGKTRPKNRKLIIILCVLVVAAVATSIIFFIKYQGERDKDTAVQKELVEKLGKVIELPSSTPAMVTVADKTKLKNQTLSARVENKDILLIYNDTKRIIIYRPSSEKIIDILTFEKTNDVPPSQ